MYVLNQHLYLSPVQYCLLMVTSDQSSQTNNQEVKLSFVKITTYFKYLIKLTNVIADHQVVLQFGSTWV